jgi:hypothetical protein
MMTQYVQHISGQGKRWEVIPGDDPEEYAVKDPDRKHRYYFLPVSEYVPCPSAGWPPPEEAREWGRS